MKARATKLGFRLVGGSPEQLGAHLRSEIDKWAKVAKAAGLGAEVTRHSGRGTGANDAPRRGNPVLPANPESIFADL